MVESRTCDNCGKRVSDEGRIRVGGSTFDGWYELTRVNGSSMLPSVQYNKDLCSRECLSRFIIAGLN